MKHQDACNLIKNDFIRTQKQIWCDFGCGSGAFTLALAELLPPESLIYAVDEDQNSLNSIPKTHQNVKIQKFSGDFVKDDFPFKNLNGILMANSLHFVRDKEAFLRKLERFAKPDYILLIVEYDNDASNPWVPYPLSFQALQSFFAENGFSSIIKLNERKSVYNNGNIYSAIVSK